MIQILNAVALKHFDWVERMGWHNKTPLESLALIASEIGEAAEELLADTGPAAFIGELADVVLRIIDFGPLYGWDLEALVARAELSDEVATMPLPLQTLGLTPTLAAAVNAARKPELGEDFQLLLGKLLAQLFVLAAASGGGLCAAVEAKMALNEQRGTRGRRI